MPHFGQAIGPSGLANPILISLFVNNIFVLPTLIVCLYLHMVTVMIFRTYSNSVDIVIHHI